MGRKRLLVDAHTFDENHQGIRTFLKGIYSSFNATAAELDVYLVANNIDNLKKEFKHKKEYKFLKLEYTNKYIRLAYELPRLIKKHKIDYAHFNYFLPLFLSKKCNYIVTIHDVLFIDYPSYFPKKYQIVNSFLYGRSARKTQILTTVSEYSKQKITEHFNTKDKPIYILPNAVNEEYLKPQNKEEDKEFISRQFNINKYIIFVSRLEPRKNHAIILKAYKQLELWKRGYSVLFIGKETFKNETLNNLITEVNNISNGKIAHLENVKNEDLIKFYNAAELSIFPSVCEGFGIPPLESGVLLTPTICSNTTAMRDFDFFGEDLIDVTSLELLKNRIENALVNKNDSRYERVSNKIKERYSWSNTAKILQSLILREGNLR